MLLQQGKGFAAEEPLVQQSIDHLFGDTVPLYLILTVGFDEANALILQGLDRFFMIYPILVFDAFEGLIQRCAHSLLIVHREPIEDIFAQHQHPGDIDQGRLGDILDFGMPLQRDGTHRRCRYRVDEAGLQAGIGVGHGKRYRSDTGLREGR